jgi:hypothetical protein
MISWVVPLETGANDIFIQGLDVASRVDKAVTVHIFDDAWPDLSAGFEGNEESNPTSI